MPKYQILANEVLNRYKILWNEAQVHATTYKPRPHSQKTQTRPQNEQRQWISPCDYRSASSTPVGWLVGWLISFSSITVGLLCRMLS